jgi:hypothetical protein
VKQVVLSRTLNVLFIWTLRSKCYRALNSKEFLAAKQVAAASSTKLGRGRVEVGGGGGGGREGGRDRLDQEEIPAGRVGTRGRREGGREEGGRERERREREGGREGGMEGGSDREGGERKTSKQREWEGVDLGRSEGLEREAPLLLHQRPTGERDG